jgi:hypothetical protein
MAIDGALAYAISTLAGGERLQPAASYMEGGEVTRAFFLGIANPDPVVEARQWLADLKDLQYVVLTYPGSVTYETGAVHKAVMAEAWERGMPRVVVIAQEYQQLPDGNADEGRPAVRAVGNELEVGTTEPTWVAQSQPG